MAIGEVSGIARRVFRFRARDPNSPKSGLHELQSTFTFVVHGKGSFCMDYKRDYTKLPEGMSTLVMGPSVIFKP